MFSKFLKIFRALSRNELISFFSAAFIFILSLIFISANFYLNNTVLRPVEGGDYREGVVGQPTYINPVLAGTNGVDRDITEVVFSNLVQLADSLKSSVDGKVWTIRLKDNAFWDDNKRLTSDDVIFTVETIQNPDTRSYLYKSWEGVSAERVSERELRFVLQSPYAFFENNLKELRPIPKHIFGDLPPANIRLSGYNLEPVGSGPFKYKSMDKKMNGFIDRYELARNERFPEKMAYLDSFIFKFYKDEKDLMDAMNSGVIDGMGDLSASDLDKLNIGHKVFAFKMPRYYAIFFNSYANPVLNDKNVRLALNYAVDKETIVGKVFGEYADLMYGPLVPGMEGYFEDVPREEFSLGKAAEILDAGGWKVGDDGIRAKDIVISRGEGSPASVTSTKMDFSIIVPPTPHLVESMNMVKENWERIEIKVSLEIKPSMDEVSELIKTRNYEMIAFGNILAGTPDLYSFWHSAEKFYPGLNLALYDNRAADSLIESIRKNLDKDSRESDLRSLQSLIAQDAPVVFLYSPDYIYISKNRLSGVTNEFISMPSDRFLGVENWYVKTARVFK